MALLSSLGPVAVAAPVRAAAPQPVTADDCKHDLGVRAPVSTWASRRLNLAKVGSVTRGRTVGTGAPVRVAVLDSGLQRTHPQLRGGLDADPVRDAIVDDPGKGFKDCVGHGTQVTAVIAAQPDTVAPGFVGVAPDVRIIPIKITNRGEVTPDVAARAIDLAVDAGAQVANLSFSLPADSDVLRAAVARADRKGMVIVAAAGNDGGDANKFTQYPAAYSTDYDNVIAVGAITQDDVPANFSGSGPYMDVVAPGENVQSIAVEGGYRVVTGTSFATPYVTGVAALVLAAHPKMTPGEVRARLRSTADGPPVTVPNNAWGYGTVDPYLAVTAVRTDPTAPPTGPARGSQVPQPVRPVAEDRSLQHAALGLGFGLLGLAALVVAAATVLSGSRRGRPARARPLD